MANCPASTLSPSRIKLITWTLLLLMPIIGMAVDLIAPSLPAIAQGLHTSNDLVKNTISIYLLGYALGNFFTGFLTDAYGRQKLLYLNLFAFSITSILPILYPSIPMLLLSRLLQGLTIGAVSVITRAILSDIYSSDKLVRLGTLIGIMWGLGPVIGPILGGYLQHAFGWQAGFYLLASLSLLILLATFFVLKETHINRHRLQIHTIKKNLIEVLKHRLFMTLVLLMGLAYSLIITFNTMGPFLIQNILHYNPVFFGHIAFALGLVFLVATFLCRRLLMKFSLKSLFFYLINVLILMTLLFLLLSLFFNQSIVLITVASGAMYFACGFLFPLAMGRGMALFQHIAGTAAAIMFLVNVLITSFTSMLISIISIHSITPLIITYTVLLSLCGLLYWKIIHKETQL